MKRLLIIYHSQSGACAHLAQAAMAGATGAGVEVRVLRACDAGFEDLGTAAGLVLVAAENSGYLSGGMKELLDRIFYPACDSGLLLPYGLIVSAGNDGRNAARQLQRIVSGIPFKPVAESLILRGEPDAAALDRASELGQSLALGLEMGIF